MEISLGFVAILILILFPGIIFRRLYFYGEFSKEFSSGYNLISLLAISSLPGLINLVLIFFFYDNFFSEIDLGRIIDKFKEIGSPNFRYTESNDIPIKELIHTKVSPFIFFLYTSSTIFGAILGRLIRITRIDTKFKLLRFKNFWFYLFHGEHTNFKKMQHLKLKNKKYLFTKADILIDSSSKTHLYSGIVVDYELQDENCKTLSKVMLQNAERYRLNDGKRERIQIPGSLLVVNCSSMKNINLTYVYEEAKTILSSRIPNYIETGIAIISLLLLPIFIFEANSINLISYKAYFQFSLFEKIITYVLTIQILGLINPFVKKDEEYRRINVEAINAKLFWIALMMSFLLFSIN